MRQELLLSQPPPPQYDVPPQRLSTRSPPQQPCSVSRVITYMDMDDPEGDGKNKLRGKLCFLYMFTRRGER